MLDAIATDDFGIDEANRISTYANPAMRALREAAERHGLPVPVIAANYKKGTPLADEFHTFLTSFGSRIPPLAILSSIASTARRFLLSAASAFSHVQNGQRGVRWGQCSQVRTFRLDERTQSVRRGSRTFGERVYYRAPGKKPRFVHIHTSSPDLAVETHSTIRTGRTRRASADHANVFHLATRRNGRRGLGWLGVGGIHHT